MNPQAKCSMENPIPLAIESFSHSWLANRRPSLDTGLDDSVIGLRSSLDNKYAIVSRDSWRKVSESDHFNFNVSMSHSPAVFVHADELFCNGFIRPTFLDNQYPKKLDLSNSVRQSPTMPLRSYSSREMIPSIRVHCSFIRKLRRLSGQHIHKWFGNLTPSCYKVGQGEAVCDWKFQAIRSWNSSPQQSPPQGTASSSAGYWSDDESSSSIYDAVLHCKSSTNNRDMKC